MRVLFEPHFRLRMAQRDVTQSEVEEVISDGVDFKAKKGRKGRFKVYPFNKLHGVKIYPQRKIEVIYIQENDTIITVTLFVYFGKWS